jgi:glutathione S-transferase
MRKVTGGIRALATWAETASSSTSSSSSSSFSSSSSSSPSASPTFLISNTLTIADIAACSALGYLALRWPEITWQNDYPHLKSYWERFEASRESFRETKPDAHVIKDRIV